MVVTMATTSNAAAARQTRSGAADWTFAGR